MGLEEEFNKQFGSQSSTQTQSSSGGGGLEEAFNKQFGSPKPVQAPVKQPVQTGLPSPNVVKNPPNNPNPNVIEEVDFRGYNPNQGAIDRLNPLQKLNYNIQKDMGSKTADKNIQKMQEQADYQTLMDNLNPNIDNLVRQQQLEHPIRTATRAFINNHWHPWESAKNATRGLAQGYVGTIGSMAASGGNLAKNTALDAVNPYTPLYKDAPETSIRNVMQEVDKKHPFKKILFPMLQQMTYRNTLEDNIRKAKEAGKELNPEYLGSGARDIRTQDIEHAVSGTVRKVPHTDWWFEEPKVSFAHKLGKFGGELLGFGKVMDALKLGNIGLSSTKLASKISKSEKVSNDIVKHYTNRYNNIFKNLVNSENKAISNKAKEFITKKIEEATEKKLSDLDTQRKFLGAGKVALDNGELGTNFAIGERAIDSLNGEDENYINPETGEKIPLWQTGASGYVGGMAMGSALHGAGKLLGAGLGKANNFALDKIPFYKRLVESKAQDRVINKMLSDVNKRGQLDAQDYNNLLKIQEVENMTPEEMEYFVKAISEGVITNKKSFNHQLAKIKAAREMMSGEKAPIRETAEPDVADQFSINRFGKPVSELTPEEFEVFQSEWSRQGEVNTPPPEQPIQTPEEPMVYDIDNPIRDEKGNIMFPKDDNVTIVDGEGNIIKQAETPQEPTSHVEEPTGQMVSNGQETLQNELPNGSNANTTENDNVIHVDFKKRQKTNAEAEANKLKNGEVDTTLPPQEPGKASNDNGETKKTKKTKKIKNKKPKYEVEEASSDFRIENDNPDYTGYKTETFDGGKAEGSDYQLSKNDPTEGKGDNYKDRILDKGKREVQKLLGGHKSALNTPTDKISMGKTYQKKQTSHKAEANKYFRDNGITDVQVNEYGHLVYKGGEKDGLPLSKRDEHRLKEKLGYANTRPFGEGAEAEDMTLRKINGQLFAVKKGVTPKEDVYYRAYSDSNGVYSIDKEPYDRFATGREEYGIDEGLSNDIDKYNDNLSIHENKDSMNKEEVEFDTNKESVPQSKIEDKRNYSNERSAKVIDSVLKGNGVKTALQEYDAKNRQDLVDLANSLSNEQAKYVGSYGKNQEADLGTSRKVKLASGKEITVNDREVAIDEILSHLAKNGITTNTKVRSISSKESSRIDRMFEKSDKDDTLGNLGISEDINGSANKMQEQLLKLRDVDKYQEFYNKLINKIDKYRGVTNNERYAMYKRAEKMADEFENKTGATVKRQAKRHLETMEEKWAREAEKLLKNNDFTSAISMFHKNNIEYDDIYNDRLRNAFKKSYEMMYKDSWDKASDLELSDYALALKAGIVKPKKGKTVKGRTSLASANNTLTSEQQRKVDLLRIKYYNQITKSRAKSIEIQNTIFDSDEPSHWVTDSDGNLKSYQKEAYDKNVDLQSLKSEGRQLTQNLMNKAKNALPENLKVISDYVNWDGSFNRGKIQTSIRNKDDGHSYLKNFFEKEIKLWEKETKSFVKNIFDDNISYDDLGDFEGKSTTLGELAQFLKGDKFKNNITGETVTDKPYDDTTLNKIQSFVKAHNEDMSISFFKPTGKYEEYSGANGFFDNNSKTISINTNGDRPYKETLLEEIIHSSSQYEIDNTPELKYLNGEAAKAGQNRIDFLNKTTDGITNAERVNKVEASLGKISEKQDVESKDLVISFLKGDTKANYSKLKDKYDVSWSDLYAYKNSLLLKSKHVNTLEEQYADAIIKGEIDDTTKFLSFCKDRGRKNGNNGQISEKRQTTGQNTGDARSDVGGTEPSRRDSGRTERLNELKEKSKTEKLTAEEQKEYNQLRKEIGRANQRAYTDKIESTKDDRLKSNKEKPTKTYSIKDLSSKSKGKQARYELGKDSIGFVRNLSTKEYNELVNSLGESGAKVYGAMADAVAERESGLIELGLTDSGRLTNASKNALASVLFKKPISELTKEQIETTELVHQGLVFDKAAHENLYFKVLDPKQGGVDFNGKQDRAVFGVRKNEVKLPDATPENIKKMVYNALEQAEHIKKVTTVSNYLKNSVGKPIEADSRGIPKIEEGYTPVNSKVLNLSLFKGLTKHAYEAIIKGEGNIEKVFKDPELCKDILDVYRQSSDYDYQIPTRIYNYLFSGTGETPYQIKSRYGRSIGDIADSVVSGDWKAIGKDLNVWGLLQGARLDSFMKPFNTKVLGLSPSWIVNNALSNAIMADKEYKSVIEQLKYYGKALKVSDENIPSDIIGNNFTNIVDMASDYNTSLYITGHQKTDIALSTFLGMSTVNTSNLKSAEKLIGEVSDKSGIPARVFKLLAKKMFNFNKDMENLQRKALFLKKVDDVTSGIDFNIVNHIGQNMTRQQMAIKYINENPELRKMTIDSVLNTLGDYESLSNFERTVLKRFVPYHKWFNTVLKWTKNYASEKPGEFGQLLLELRRFYDKNYDYADEQKFSIPLYKNKNGEQIIFNLKNANPISTIGELGLGVIHPLLKDIVEAPSSDKVTFHGAEKKSKRYKFSYKDKNKVKHYTDTKTGKKLTALPLSEKAKYTGMQILNQQYLPINNKLIDITGDISALANYASIDPYNKKAGQLTPKQGQFDTSLGRYNSGDKVGYSKTKENPKAKKVKRKAAEYSGVERFLRKGFAIQKANKVDPKKLKDPVKRKEYEIAKEKAKRARKANSKINRYFY